MSKTVRDIAETVSAVIAALAALGAAVALLGGALILFRLDENGLPGDLGVVTSLPGSFVLATGLTYVGLPTVVALAITALGARLVGPRRENRWPWHQPGRSLIYLASVVTFSVLPLAMTTLERDPTPGIVWVASVVAGVGVAFGLKFLWRPAPDLAEGRRLKRITELVPVHRWWQSSS